MMRMQAPASKSMSHRLLIGAALAPGPGPSELRQMLDCDDVCRTRACLQAAGADIRAGETVWQVSGLPAGPRGGSPDAPARCDVHASGTTCRLLTAVLAAGHGCFSLYGAQRLHQRPLGALLTALRALGADIDATDNAPPLLIRADGLSGGTLELPLDESSQFLSGLLLAAPLCGAPLRVVPTGRLVSWPYVRLTLHTLELFGLTASAETRQTDAWRPASWRALTDVQPGNVRLCVRPGQYRPGAYTVEGDWSGASYLLAAGAVGRHEVCVTGLRQDSAQGDRRILELLRAMGAQVTLEACGVRVAPSALHGIDVDLHDCPDLVPTLAVLAACAAGETRIRNVAQLRLKECDRLHALATELGRLGVTVDEAADGLRVSGLGAALCVPEGTVFCAHDDHRVAMALALTGLRGRPARVDRPEVVNKSFPRFWELWRQLH